METRKRGSGRLGRLGALFLAAALSLAVPALAVYETPTFSDVPKSFWGYASIEKAAENKWISGNPDGTFGPNALTSPMRNSA